MSFLPIRGSNGYIGIAKQGSGQGTAAAPTNFLRWLKGSGIITDVTYDEAFEGDTTRRKSQSIKKGQRMKVKLICLPRPVELGLLETAIQGANSDTVTAPVANTTFSSPAVAGATTISLASNTGLTSGGTAVLDLSAGTAREEVVTVTVPGTGAGPYVYTLANGATLKNAHNNADTAQTAASHAIVDTNDGNWYSLEVSLGGTSGIIIRLRDCKVDQAKITNDGPGRSLKYEIDFIGLVALVQASAATVTLEARQQFLYAGQSAFTLEGSATGDALEIEKFTITRKNNLDWVQAEQLVGDSLIFTGIDIEVDYDYIWNTGDSTRVRNVLFGGPAGTTDAQAMYTGPLNLKFTQADAFHTVQYNLPSLSYPQITMPMLDDAGNHFIGSMKGLANSNMGANTVLLTTTVTNTQTASY